MVPLILGNPLLGLQRRQRKSSIKKQTLDLPETPNPEVVSLNYIGIMEKKIETIGIIGGQIGVLLGFYRDNGKENGNYYLGFRV